jgi:cation:H+ antiporter
MFIMLQHAKRGEKKEESEENEDAKERERTMAVWKMVALILVGLACLVLGSNVFVDGATKVATALGISDAVIGLTVVAMGTSIPELATSVVAARKGNSGIAIGNVLGSNVFNILLVIGLTGVISPMHIQGITWIDLSMLILSMVLLLLFSYTKYTIARWEGAVLTTLFVGYITWVIMNL